MHYSHVSRELALEGAVMLLALLVFFPKKHVAVVPDTGKDLLLASQV